MLTHRDQQKSFYDADSVCERLIPEDSFYRKFREIVSPLIADSMFGSMYCLDNGRPPISPSLLAMACVLQFHRNLSDRDMERACMYDIEVKYALGLRLDERPFDHSSLGDFRKRLLENGKEKEIFDRVLSVLVDRKLIRKDEIQRVDATHVIADIAVPTMVTLVKKGIRDVLKPLGKRHRKVLEQLGQEIAIDEYGRHSVNDSRAGKNDPEKRSERLVVVVGDARKVIKKTRGIKGDPILKRRVDTLCQILQENIDSDDEGKPKEITKKEKPPDILVSPVDPDARYGAKSRTKKFMGYKANVTETVESRFITNIAAMPGNRRDAATLAEEMAEQKK
ncbi:MAG: transposase, partial [Deltaproteobacteria bacterium]|nr:transposase [Deltaproteobacteria bacterium]